MRDLRVDIAHGFIVRIAPWNGQRDPDDDPNLLVERVRGGLLLPSFANAHSHAFQRAFRGRVQWRRSRRDDFWTWRDAMYRAANALPPEGIEAVSRLAFLEMAEAGIGLVGEFHYLHHAPDGTRYADPDEIARRVIAAALDVGIRITLLRCVYASGGIGVPLRPDQARFGDANPDAALAAVERLRAGAHPRVKIGLAPHSVRAVPRDWLPAFAAFDGPVHAHVSEQPGENEACMAALGRSPLHVFADAGLVNERFTAVHLTHPLPGDIDALAVAGARICACPTTELDLGDGFLPLDAHRVEVCVGSDSHATIDLFEEVRLLEGHARAQSGRRVVLGDRDDGLAEHLLEIAAGAGRRALGWAGAHLEVGAPADLVAIDLGAPAALGVPPVAAAAFSARPEWVRSLWIGGESIVSNGRHRRRAEILADALPWLEAVA